MTMILWAIVIAGALSIVYGIVTTRGLLAADAGSARMQEISAAVREGASAYLRRQYTTIAIVGVVIFILAFWLLGAAQAALTLSNIPVEERSWIYLLRLAAFSLILLSIWTKNRRS